MHFYRFTTTMKGIVSSTEPLNGKLESIVKPMGGVQAPIKQQGKQTKEIKFGFTAVDPELARQMKFQVGDELPLEITDKPVINTQTGEVIPNLFWAH